MDYGIASFIGFKRPVLSGFSEVAPSLTRTLQLSFAGIPLASKNKCARSKWLSKSSSRHLQVDVLQLNVCICETIDQRQCRFLFKCALLTPSSLQLLQLHITVSPEKVKLNVDCQEVAEKPIKEAKNITLDGFEVLGKMVKSGGRRQSASVSEKAKGFKMQRAHALARHQLDVQNLPGNRFSFSWLSEEWWCCACFLDSEGLFDCSAAP